MATVSWAGSVSGNWTLDPGDWSSGNVPQAGDDVDISVGGAYTVTITAQINAINSLTIGDTSAILEILDPGATQSITGSLSNSGTVELVSSSTLSVGGSLDNTGTLAIDDNSSSTGSFLSVAGDLTNSGQIRIGAVDTSNGQIGGDSLSVSGTLANTGVIDIYDNSAVAMVVTVGSLAATGGQINLIGDRFGGGAGAAELIVNGGATVSANVSIGSHAVLDVTGIFDETGGTTTVTGTLSAAGVDVTGGRLVLDSALAGSLPITLGGTGIVEFGTTVASGEVVTFGAGGELVLDQPGGFAGAVAQFKNGETIDLKGIGLAASYTYAGGVLDLKNAGGTVIAALSLTTPIGSPHFLLGTDGSGGTLLQIQNPNTFSGSYPGGIVLSTPSTQNPATITASAFVGTGTIATDPNVGVLGTAGFAWTVTNYGHVEGKTDGVYLTAGGTLTNRAATAFIEGGNDGILVLNQAGSVSNFGTIEGGTAGSGTGVDFYDGGSVINQAGGTVSGYSGAVHIYGASGTIVNYGSIVATGTGFDKAVYLGNGGSVVNETGGFIGGYSGVVFYGTGGTVVNYGRIAGSLGHAVYFEVAGSVTNKAGGILTGYTLGVGLSGGGTLVNSGSIAADSTISAVGVSLGAGGIVSNGQSGLISGHIAVDFSGYGALVNHGTITASTTGGVFGAGAYLNAGGSVDNFGTIAGTGTNNGGVKFADGGVLTNEAGGLIAGAHGVFIDAASGTLVNFGTIDAYLSAAVYLGGGGSVTNSAGVTISGYSGGVEFYSVAGSLVNSGAILAAGSDSSGVDLAAGGTVTNKAGATISGMGDGVVGGTAATVVNSGFVSGNYYGVELSGAAASVANYGTITGGRYGVFMRGSGSTLVNDGTIIVNGGTAVALLGSGNRLIDDPGAVFTGIVYGGTGNDTLELASASSTGTLTGLGTNFTGFQNVVVDAGAVWKITDPVIISPPAFTNDGTIIVNAGTVDFGAVGEDLGDRGVIDIGRNGLALFDGTVAAGQTIGFIGTGAQADLADASGFAGAVTNFQAGDTIDFEGIVANGTNYAGGVLTLTDNGIVVAEVTLATNQGSPVFHLGTDGSGGTDLTLQPSLSNIFSGYFPNGIVLDDAATQNPATITATGTVTNKSGSIAVFGTGGYDWTLTNLGYIDGTAFGVSLTAGGVVVNGTPDPAPGYIEGNIDGVKITGGAGTVGNYGTIIGETGDGVYLGDGGSVVNGTTANTAAYIRGYFDGVLIANGKGTVVNYGMIRGSGTTGTGIGLRSGGIVHNSGLIHSRFVGVYVTGAAGTVTNTGTIEAATTGNNSNTVILVDGGYVQNLGVISNAGHGNGDFAVQIGVSAAGTIVNGSRVYTAALIEAYHNAIITGTAGGPSTLTNFGTIETTGTNNYNVISFRDGGAITNKASGLISGFSGGILVTEAAGTIDNDGTIESAGTRGSGVVLAAGGSLSNTDTGSITGYANGIIVAGGTGMIANYGTILGNGTSADGIYMGDGGLIANGASGTSYGLIVGGRSGAVIAGQPGTVVNYGTIDSTSSILFSGSLHGTGVLLADGGTLVNGAGALIEAYELGVYIGGLHGTPTPGAVGTVVNYGTIETTALGTVAAAAVVLAEGGSVANYGLIESAARTGISIRGTLGTMTNLGTVESNAAYYQSAAYLGAGGIVTNGASGPSSALIEAGWIGVNLKAGGTLVNYGTVESLGTQPGTSGNQGLAVFMPKGGYVVNYGLIEAAGFTAIFMGGSAGVPIAGGVGTVVNLGTVESTQSNAIGLAEGGIVMNGDAGDTTALIEGGANAVAIYIGGIRGTVVSGAAGTVVNYGTVENATTLHSAIVLAAGGGVTNQATGLILGGLDGLSTVGLGGSGGMGTVVNRGSIEGETENGIHFGAGGRITNSGLVSGATNGVLLTGSQGATVTNTGLIEGNVGVYISASDTGVNRIVNDATVSGSGGTAILFSGGTDTLVIDPAAVFIGSIVGDGALSTLELAAGDGTGTLALGGSITGFGHVKVDAGAVWQISDPPVSPPAFTNNGTILVSGRLAFGNVGQNKHAHGTINLAAGATAEFDGSVKAHQKFVFTGNTGTLRLEDASAFSGKIARFAAGDLIDIVESGANGFSFAASFADHTLTVTYFGVTIASLKLAGKFSTSDFALTADGRGGVYVSLGTPGPAALSRATHGFGGGLAGSPAAAAPAFTPFGAAGSLYAASLPAAGNSLLQNLADPFHFWTIQN
ncbi:MAG TPA: hypothetical protein VM755_06265 [Stellaceae bacterium]|nr:hypothetical protein [Stellaceae bacterium]